MWSRVGPEEKRRHGIYVLCQCTCGIEQWVRQVYLLGNASSCISCAKGNNINGPVRGWYLTRTVKSANKRGIEFNLTLQELNDLWTGTCALTGFPLHLGMKHDPDNTASLDRIDSNTGYVYSNVQWVHKLVNAMKSDLDQHQFIELCKLVANHSKGENTI